MNALALVTAVLLHAAPDDVAALAAIVEGAEEVHISLVELSFARFDEAEGPPPRLEVRSPIRKLDPKDAREVSRIVAERALSPEPPKKLCGFNPDLRLTFKKGTQSVQAIFCFSCSDVLIQRRDGRPYGLSREFRGHKAALEALVARIYADLPEKERELGSGF